MDGGKGECRACRAQETRSRKHLSLNSNGLDGMFFDLTQIQLLQGSKYNLICQKCCKMLQNYTDFRLQCLMSNSYFRELEIDVVSEDDFKDESVVQQIKVEPDLSYDSEVKIEEFNYDTLEEEISVKKEKGSGKKQTKKPKARAKKVVTPPPPELGDFDRDFDDGGDLQEIEEDIKVEFPAKKQKSNEDYGFQQPAIEPSATIYVCPNCPEKVFTIRSSYKKHLSIHKEGKYICHFCDRRFTKKYFIVGHIDRHHLEKDFGKKGEFPCDQCEKRYLTQFRLTQHLGNHKIKMKPCPYCGKMVKNLTSHLMHHDNTPERYQCDQCPKSYKSKKHVLIHAKVHENKLYTCHICNRAFNRPDKLHVHMKIHDPNRKTYECPECHKKCTFKTALTNHMRLHTGERPYQCLVCGMAFAMQGNLQKHMHTHTGTKPYMCNFCKYGTKKKPEYQAHILQIHPEMAYTLGPTYSIKIA